MYSTLVILSFVSSIVAQNCGPQAGGARCITSGYPCCSQYGWCGSSTDHCGVGCQSSFGLYCNTPSPTPPPTPSPSCKNDAVLPVVVNRCIVPKTVALTFDDGPFMYTSKVLDVLKTNRVKATFFVNGNNRMDIRSPEAVALLKRTYVEGHQIASHTWSHTDLTTLNETGIVREMFLLDDALFNIVGKRPMHMRPPYGSTNVAVERVMAKLHYRMVLWSLDTNDWKIANGVPNIQEIVAQNTQNAIVLQHDSLQYAAEFAQQLIDHFKSKGQSLVTVAECLGERPYF